MMPRLRTKGEPRVPSVRALRKLLSEIAAEYPPPPPREPGLDLVLHDRDLYVRRTAFDLHLLLSRLPERGPVCDIGGGFGLFSLGLASLGRPSMLVDDFDWLRRHEMGPTVFAMFDRRGVQAIQRDVIAEGLDFPDGSLAAVTAFHVMEHVHSSPKRLHAAIVRSLLPGGVFMLGGPNCVNLRKRITVPLGKSKWSQMADWYEAETFRGHVREPDVADLHYIARDMGLRDVEIHGRNFLGMRSDDSVKRRLAHVSDRVLALRPSLCSDIYLLGAKAS